MSKLQIVDKREVLGKGFKVYGDFENPLFLAKDVAEWINYDVSNVSKMVSNIDEDEKITARTNNTSAIFLTEDGLYEVLMLSRKPIAKVFKKEVKKILKELRIKGTYSIEDNNINKTSIESDGHYIRGIKVYTLRDIANEIGMSVDGLKYRLKKLTFGRDYITLANSDLALFRQENKDCRAGGMLYILTEDGKDKITNGRFAVDIEYSESVLEFVTQLALI